jgi:hypothetical protein
MKVREKNFVEIARADARFDGSQGRTAAAIEEKLLSGGFHQNADPVAPNIYSGASAGAEQSHFN